MKTNFNRYLLGPFSMLLALVIVHLANQFIPITPTLALTIIPMTLAQYYGGRRASLACAAMVSLYALVAFDPSRAIQISICYFFAAWLGSELKQRERTANVYLQRNMANEARLGKFIQPLKLGQPLTRDDIDELWRIRSEYNQTVTMAYGYQQIVRDMERAREVKKG